MEDMNLIRKVVWAFAKKTTIEFDELMGEASLAYSEAILSYKDDAGACFGTHAFTCMKNHLINVCKKQYRVGTITHRYDDIPEGVLPENELNREFNFEEYTSGWPEPCKELAGIVLKHPEKFLGETPNLKRSGGKKERIRRELLRKGWAHKEINDTIKRMPVLIA